MNQGHDGKTVVRCFWEVVFWWCVVVSVVVVAAAAWPRAERCICWMGTSCTPLSVLTNWSTVNVSFRMRSATWWR